MTVSAARCAPCSVDTSVQRSARKPTYRQGAYRRCGWWTGGVCACARATFANAEWAGSGRLHRQPGCRWELPSTAWHRRGAPRTAGGRRGPSGTVRDRRGPSGTVGDRRGPSGTIGDRRLPSGIFGDRRGPSGTVGDSRGSSRKSHISQILRDVRKLQTIAKIANCAPACAFLPLTGIGPDPRGADFSSSSFLLLLSEPMAIPARAQRAQRPRLRSRSSTSTRCRRRCPGRRSMCPRASRQSRAC